MGTLFGFGQLQGESFMATTAERTEAQVGVKPLRQLDGRLAWLNNGSCRYEEALAAAEQGSEYPDDLGLATWSLVELIEAAVRSGRTEKATRAFHQLSAATLASGSDRALGITARCRALISVGGEAELLYREAIERLGRTTVGVELAACPSPVRRVASPRRTSSRRSHGAQTGPWDLQFHGRRGLRRAGAAGTAGYWRDGTQPQSRDPGRIDPPGTWDLEARLLRLYQRRDTR